jgi:hypothetical protein
VKDSDTQVLGAASEYSRRADRCRSSLPFDASAVSKGESLTTELEKTISDLERQREAIDRAISALREITGTARTTTKRSSIASLNLKKRGKRRITPEGKARIAEAQRQRWAAKRAAEAQAASKRAAASTPKKQSRGKKAAKKKAGAKAAAPAPTKVAAAIAG